MDPAEGHGEGARGHTSRRRGDRGGLRRRRRADRPGVDGRAALPEGLTRGLQYTVWSYAPQPTPAELNRSQAVYPAALTRSTSLLDVWPRRHGAAVRRRRPHQAADGAPRRAPEISRYVPLEKTALSVAARRAEPVRGGDLARVVVPDAAAASRTRPRRRSISEAPLVGFVVETRAGLLPALRGRDGADAALPRRAGAGRGRVLERHVRRAARGVWTVTDHDAHAWVEAWFRGYGWLPFDPTPGVGRPERGQLERALLGGVAEVHAARDRHPGRRAGRSCRRRPAHRHGEAGRAEAAGSGAVGRCVGVSRHRQPARAACAARRGGARRHRAREARACAGLRYASRDPRRVAAACRQELADYLLDQRIDAARSATLHELGALVREELAVDPDRFVAAATAARFGPPAGARPAARDARRELRALMRVVRARLTRTRAAARAAVRSARSGSRPDGCGRDGRGRGLAPAAADRALAEADPADRRAARDRDAPARARRRPGSERAFVVTGHLAEQVEALVGDGSGFGLDVALRPAAGRARLGRHGAARRSRPARSRRCS